MSDRISVPGTTDEQAFLMVLIQKLIQNGVLTREQAREVVIDARDLIHRSDPNKSSTFLDVVSKFIEI